MILGWATVIAAAAAPANDPARARLEVAVSDDLVCPSQAALEDLVAAHLGYAPFAPDAALHIRVEVRATADHLVARVEAEGPEGPRGRRDLESRSFDCTELSAALALAIAIAIDPLSLTRAPPSEAPPSAPTVEPPPLPPTAAPPQASPPAPPAASPAEPPPLEESTPWRLRALITAHGVLAASPQPSAGLSVELVSQWEIASIALGARADIPTQATAGGGTVSAALALATLAPCVHVDRFFGCALLGAGAVWGSGHGLAAGRTYAMPYVAAGGRLGAEIATWGRVSLGARLEILATLVATTLLVGATPSWRTPDVSGTLGVVILVDAI